VLWPTLYLLLPFLAFAGARTWGQEPLRTTLDITEPGCWNHVARCVDAHAHALPPTQPLLWTFPLHFAERTFWDTAYMFTAPGRWERHDWERFTLLTGIAGGSFALDHQVDIESRGRHPRSKTERDIENRLKDFGSYPAIAGMLGGSLLGGLIFQNEEAKNLAVDAGEAVLISNLVLTEPLKETIGRSRPNAGGGPWHFHPFSGAASMPSGHATTAFSLAAALSEHFENTPAAAVPAYALVSDVVVGAIIGTVSGRTVVKLERDRRHDAEGGPRPSGLRLEPWLGIDIRGIQVVSEW